MPSSCPSEGQFRAFVTTGTIEPQVIDHIAVCANCRKVIERLSLHLPKDRAGRIVEFQSPTKDVAILPNESGKALAGGPFHILRNLHVGASNQVFEAIDQRNNRRVAIKSVRPDNLSVNAFKRLEYEARTLAMLRHPGIVQAREWDEQPGAPYLVMDFVDGVPLSEKLKRGPMAPGDAARMARGLALALAHVHQSGFLHGDIQPSNIILEDSADAMDRDADLDKTLAETWQPKLIGFGQNWQMEGGNDCTPGGFVPGAALYIAPEQMEYRKDLIGPRSDIYALGCVLYHCLTGRPPFSLGSETNLLQMMRLLDPPQPRSLNRTVPRDLEAICLKCLRKEPTERYRSAAELADDLTRFLEGCPIETNTCGTLHKAHFWHLGNRRPSTVLGTLALILSSLAVMSAFYLWSKVLLPSQADRAASQNNQSLEETAQTYLRNAHEMAATVSGFPRISGNQMDPETHKLIEKFVAIQRRQVEEFASHPQLNNLFPEVLAELEFFHARMCDEAGDRSGALAGDHRMLEILAGIDQPSNESIKRELAAVITVGTDLLLKEQPRQAKELWLGLWNRRRSMPAERLRADSDLWKYLDNLGTFTAAMMNQELGDKKGAGVILEQLADLRQKVGQILD